jgi:TetR/AcrR family transcriptional regulator, cholesterol catabolism regulator
MGRPNRRAERRGEILAAAKRVAVRDGAAEATLRAIATEAGMEPPAVLYYFDGLAEIVRELVFASTDAFIERIESAVAEADHPAARLEAAIVAGTTGGLDSDDSRILYEYWSTGVRDSDMNDADRALDRREVAIYERIIRDGAASGAFRPTLDATQLGGWTFVALEDGLVMDILNGTKSREDVIELIWAVAGQLVGLQKPAHVGGVEDEADPLGRRQ